MARFLINRITLIKLYPQNFILKRSRIVRSTKYLSAAADAKSHSRQGLRKSNQEDHYFFASWRLCANKKSAAADPQFCGAERERAKPFP